MPQLIRNHLDYHLRWMRHEKTKTILLLQYRLIMKALLVRISERDTTINNTIIDSECYHNVLNKETSTLDIKKTYLAPINYLCMDLAFFWGVLVPLHLFWELHLNQLDTLVNVDPMAELFDLIQIHNSRDSVHKHSIQDDAWQVKLTSAQKNKLLQLVVYGLMERQGMPSDYLVIYRGLFYEDQKEFLMKRAARKDQFADQNRYQRLEAQLLHCPDSVGRRRLVLQQREQWQQTLLSEIAPVTARQTDGSKKPIELQWVDHHHQPQRQRLAVQVASQLFYADGSINEAERIMEGRRVVIPIKNETGAVIAFRKELLQGVVRNFIMPKNFYLQEKILAGFDFADIQDTVKLTQQKIEDIIFGRPQISDDCEFFKLKKLLINDNDRLVEIAIQAERLDIISVSDMDVLLVGQWTPIIVCIGQ